ncbi:S-adenosyl-L-methionine-dependent methyltransferase [Mytilinidion resinicola]|uniref:S-adenosyl-L-methionine-dependent methyltransferase n=1 Tax=Mytilinidion resinicola TaxID=574789 RepID=A0A6A6Z855_9PEZI|nr:S-adenosyl-L-methionine-dependent methyltransferase [Mytilinidion resinicola]KAF2816484.1 S-adenosyl-L-methionine-dependent methyltransferase [Mytilinidion resinicola]
MTSTSTLPPPKDTFTTGYNKASLDRYAFRNVQTCCTYLLPYLSALPPNFTFLDLGCGPGSITADLASRFPDAHFTGVDPAQLFIDKAVALAAERGVSSNTSFIKGAVESLKEVLGDKWGTFDVVHCHQVLNHIKEAVAAMQTMKGAARADGGLVAAREATTTNGDVFYPLLPGIAAWQKLTGEIIGAQKSGPVSGLGPRLLEVALGAGWRREQIKAGASSWCYSEPPEKKMWVESMVGMLQNKESDWYKKAVGTGVKEEELEEMVEAWKEWEGRDESWCVFVSAEVVCRNG